MKWMQIAGDEAKDDFFFLGKHAIMRQRNHGQSCPYQRHQAPNDLYHDALACQRILGTYAYNDDF